jgi:hypothetical protein
MLFQLIYSVVLLSYVHVERFWILNYAYTTASCWQLNWGGSARGNGWSGKSGMVSNISNTWKPFAVAAIIMSCPPLSSLR